MILITSAQIKHIMPNASAGNIAKYLPHINTTMDRYKINTKQRQASFLGRMTIESGSLMYVREIASGRAYEGRKDLGNTTPGDGVMYKGRGLMQITGRFNYAAVSKAFNYDFIKYPTKLEEPLYAALAAGWFWDINKINAIADTEDIKAVVKKVNGGYNGLQETIDAYTRALEVL